MSAYTELMDAVGPDEQILFITFGSWGWSGYGEPEAKFVPKEKQGVMLTLAEAKPYMEGWSFLHGYGAPRCYAIHAWTNKNVYFIVQYDGSTQICSVPRNPSNAIPDMPGG